MLDMRFSGLPRFINGFRTNGGPPGNDDVTPWSPAMAASANGRSAGTGRPPSDMRPMFPPPARRILHLTLVE